MARNHAFSRTVGEMSSVLATLPTIDSSRPLTTMANRPMFLCMYDGYCLKQVDPTFADRQRPEAYKGTVCLSNCEYFDDCGACKQKVLAPWKCDYCRREISRKAKQDALTAECLTLIGKLKPRL